VRDLTNQSATISDRTSTCNAEILHVLEGINKTRGNISGMTLPFSVAETLDLAKADHLVWKARVIYMLRGLMKLDAANIENHHVCRLGKWYDSLGKEQFGHLSSFKELDSVHAQFHHKCAETIRCYQRNDIASTQRLLPEIESLSTSTIGILNKLKQSL
jgi:methyl-accepting chemotaxis protein